MSNTMKCNGPNCGVEILRAEIDGKKIPLNKTRARAYIRVRDGFKQLPEPVYISHFWTCPDKDKFSGRNKSGRTTQQSSDHDS